MQGAIAERRRERKEFNANNCWLRDQDSRQSIQAGINYLFLFLITAVPFISYEFSGTG